MKTYLDIACGDFRLLLPAESVVEIMAAGVRNDLGTRSHAFRPWRDRQLPVVNLAAFLGATPAAHGEQVVISDEAGHLTLLEVDRVLGLREVADSAFAPLPAVTPALLALVDAVAPAPEGDICRLRLRRPWAWSAAGEGDAP